MIDGEDGTETELPLFEEGPTEGVELELDEDDLDGDPDGYLDGEEEETEPEAEEAEEEEAEEEEAEEEEEEAEEEDHRPRKRDAEKRIVELARRAQEAERRAQEIEARLQHEAVLRQQSDLAMMTHYEQRLKGESNFVRGQLQEAISMGDTEKQIDLQTKLMQLQQDLSGVDAWRKETEVNMLQAQQQQTAPQPVEPQQQQITLEPRTRDWIAKNTWFQPNSPDFDPEMHEDATIYARRLERRYKAEGRAEEIGGAAYFKEIDKYLRAEFADAFQDQPTPKKGTPKMKRDNTVAPVARSGGGEAAPVKRTAKVSLSPSERQFARNMAASGAYRKPNGQRMTDAEAEKYHAAFILKQRKG
jgi:hypothetical protein